MIATVPARRWLTKKSTKFFAKSTKSLNFHKSVATRLLMAISLLNTFTIKKTLLRLWMSFKLYSP